MSIATDTISKKRHIGGVGAISDGPKLHFLPFCHMTTSNPRPSDEWKPCPPGYLAEVTSQEKRTARRDFLYKSGGVGLVAVLAAIGVRFGFSKNDEKPDPMEFAISCRKVRENMDDYVLATISDQKLVVSIDKHLYEYGCKGCCDYLDTRKAALSV